MEVYSSALTIHMQICIFLTTGYSGEAHHCDLLALVAHSVTMAAKKGAEALAGTVNKCKVTIATGEVGCEEWMEAAELESRKRS